MAEGKVPIVITRSTGLREMGHRGDWPLERLYSLKNDNEKSRTVEAPQPHSCTRLFLAFTDPTIEGGAAVFADASFEELSLARLGFLFCFT